MIPLVRLAKSGISTSRLGFGTSRLHYLDRKQRQVLLTAAADIGFVHFDTAPAYGDGLSEVELGRFIKGERARFVVATKYGIPADRLIEGWPFVGVPMRAAKALARRIGLRHYRLPPLSAAKLRESAELSLRRLKIDYIDILFLHEPSPERLARPVDIVEEFAKLKQRGLIRAFGVAGSWAGLAPLVRSTPELANVIQTAESEWHEKFPPDISYGAAAAGAQSYFATGIRSEQVLKRLRSALTRRPQGAVLVSTTKIDHLRLLATAAQDART
jgi:D-threo-aldose 1-dehydrogenase